jgi:hypothetical protein
MKERISEKEIVKSIKENVEKEVRNSFEQVLQLEADDLKWGVTIG